MNTDMILGDEKILWNGAHQVNQQQEVNQNRIPRNGRENGYCVHVGDII